MRHVKRYAKLGRDSAHRRSMLRNLTTQFFIHGYIKTTVSRAKAVQPIIERCITRAIKAHHGDLGAYRSFTQYLHPTTHTLKVYRYFADHKDHHQGGRTSLKKLGVHRMGDNAPMALLHLITSSVSTAPSTAVQTAGGPDQANTKSSAGKSNAAAKSTAKNTLAASDASAAAAEPDVTHNNTPSSAAPISADNGVALATDADPVDDAPSGNTTT